MGMGQCSCIHLYSNNYKFDTRILTIITYCGWASDCAESHHILDGFSTCWKLLKAYVHNGINHLSTGDFSSTPSHWGWIDRGKHLAPPLPSAQLTWCYRPQQNSWEGNWWLRQQIPSGNDCYIAIEHGPIEIVSFPINSMVIFHRYVSVPEGICKYMQIWWFN